jgi:hypothetical protein
VTRPRYLHPTYIAATTIFAGTPSQWFEEDGSPARPFLFLGSVLSCSGGVSRGSGRVSAGWMSVNLRLFALKRKNLRPFFLLFSAYLLGVKRRISHCRLERQTPVKAPIGNVEIAFPFFPLFGGYA